VPSQVCYKKKQWGNFAPKITMQNKFLTTKYFLFFPDLYTGMQQYRAVCTSYNVHFRDPTCSDADPDPDPTKIRENLSRLSMVGVLKLFSAYFVPYGMFHDIFCYFFLKNKEILRFCQKEERRQIRMTI
jgi:hypothetical protein